MNPDPSDPRLTAYVLGELEPAERENVEHLLSVSPECRQAVEEIRLTVDWLSRELRHEAETQPPAAAIDHQPVAPLYGNPLSKPHRGGIGMEPS